MATSEIAPAEYDDVVEATETVDGVGDELEALSLVYDVALQSDGLATGFLSRLLASILAPGGKGDVRSRRYEPLADHPSDAGRRADHEHPASYETSFVQRCSLPSY